MQIFKSNALKRVYIILIILIQMTCFISPSFAQKKYSFKNKEIHRQLYEVRRYTRTPEYYAPSDEELGVSVNRELGIIAVLRLLAYDNYAEELSNEEVKRILSKYTDADGISEWARKIIAYAVKNKIISGVSEQSLGLKESFTGRMFSAVALKAMGYKLDSEDYECATAVLAEKGGLSIRQAVLLNDKKLIQDDMIGMLYELLKAERPDKQTVIKKLIDDGIADKEKAIKYNLIKQQ